MNLQNATAKVFVAACIFAVSGSVAAIASDPLPSWNEGKTKSAIVDFVQSATRKGPKFIPVAERIATFDNDGTLWVEQPLYVQLMFALDRVKALAPQHPEWNTTEPFKSVLEGNLKNVIAAGEKGLVEITMATHAGMTTAEFEQTVKTWLATATNSRYTRPYTELSYQPMVELLDYMRKNDFKTYIVTGGGIEFVRPFSQAVYGIPPEQVIGSSIKTKFEMVDGKPVIKRLPAIDFVDDKDGKPLAINKFIGRRPVAAFGNSDGDLQMLQWTDAGINANAPHLCVFIHHTDAEREYAYDRQSEIGKLDQGLDQAAQRGWTVVDMKKDWKNIFTPHPGECPD